jgi:leader peptidase (prepilin peptidase) / N-methyltransferase
MAFFYHSFIFALGLIAGSFLNCVVYRLENKKSFLKGRSFCPNCKKTLDWTDLIPVLSFFLLKGKCRSCSSRISWQYPLVELSTGLMFLLISVSLFPNIVGLSVFQILNLFYYLAITFLLIFVFVYDLKHFIIPDGAVIIASGFSLSWLLFNFLTNVYSLKEISLYFFSGLGASFFFLFFYLISKGKWMGFGDVKLAFALGLFLGFPEIATALFLAFLIGSVVGLIIVVAQKKNIKSEIPFAPFLVTGTLLAFLWGDIILSRYLALF